MCLPFPKSGVLLNLDLRREGGRQGLFQGFGLNVQNVAEGLRSRPMSPPRQIPTVLVYVIYYVGIETLGVFVVSLLEL
jgi:hypothetical protein